MGVNQFEALPEAQPSLFELLAPRVIFLTHGGDGAPCILEGQEDAVPPNIEGFEAFHGEGVREDEVVHREVQAPQLALHGLDVGEAGAGGGKKAFGDTVTGGADHVQGTAEFAKCIVPTLFEEGEAVDDVGFEAAFKIEKRIGSGRGHDRVGRVSDYRRNRAKTSLFQGGKTRHCRGARMVKWWAGERVCWRFRMQQARCFG